MPPQSPADTPPPPPASVPGWTPGPPPLEVAGRFDTVVPPMNGIGENERAFGEVCCFYGSGDTWWRFEDRDDALYRKHEEIIAHYRIPEPSANG
jgi:hypothetical protein